MSYPDSSTGDRFSLINRRNLNCRRYTQTLISEALRVGLLPMETVDDVQMQIMGILEGLMRERKRATGREPDEDEARRLLDSIFYTVDTYLLTFHDPMYAISAVQSTGIDEMFRGGRQHIKTMVCESVSLYVQVKKTRIHCENRAYNDAVSEDIRRFLASYDHRYAAHVMPSIPGYRLLESGRRRQIPEGICFIRDYLRRLLEENRLLALFDSEERDLLYASYAAVHGTNARDCKDNMTAVVLTHALGASILGKYTGILTLTEQEVAALTTRFYRKTTGELEEMAREAGEALLRDMHPEDAACVRLVRNFAVMLAARLVEARNAGDAATVFVSSDPVELFRQ